MSTKLLVIGEQGITTGFEKVVRGVCSHLQARGDYDVVVRGIGFDAQYPARRYPYAVKEIGATDEDIFGVANFATWLKEDRPDAVFMVHDIWQIGQFLPRKPADLPWVAYFPVDAPHVKAGYALGLGAVNEAVTYTRFGAKESALGVRAAVESLRRSMQPTYGDDAQMTYYRTLRSDGELVGRWDRLLRYQSPANYNVIPHGHEHGLFTPRDKARARSLLGIPSDAFVVLNVGTNSARKRLDLTIRAFRQLARHRKDAYLVLHCTTMGTPYGGWDLTDAAQYYGVQDRLILSHQLYPNMSDDELCWLYNAADVQVNTSGGEAWSLTQFEGASCAVPQLVPDWSGTRELWQGHGDLIPVANMRMREAFLNTVHAEIDTEWLGRRLVELADAPGERDALAAKALAHASSQHSWATVGEAFHQVLANALTEPAVRGVSFDELEVSRGEDLYSEGARD